VRIRQVRPEFWTDERMASLSPAVRLFYIGLWNVADDAGWLEWQPARIGAVLLPYESAKRRERDIVTWGENLVEIGRLTVHACGCAEIPTLSRHQRVTGKQAFTYRERHLTHGVEKPVPPSLRQQVLARDGYECRLCGRPVTDKTLVLAHVDPREPKSLANLVVACRRCNYRQGTKQLSDCGMELRPVPIAPTRSQELSDSPVTLGNVTERNVLTTNELLSLRDAEDAEAVANLEHHRRLQGQSA